MVEMSVLVFILLVILIVALVVISFAAGVYMGMSDTGNKDNSAAMLPEKVED